MARKEEGAAILDAVKARVRTLNLTMLVSDMPELGRIEDKPGSGSLNELKWLYGQ